jgi:hypothetical protein
MERKAEKVKTHAGQFLKYLWIGFGITLFFIILFAGLGKISPIPFILAITGMATFISGGAMGFKPLIVGGIVFWIGAALAASLPGPEQLLVNAAITFFGYIIPGIMLKRTYKKEQHVQTA